MMSLLRRTMRGVLPAVAAILAASSSGAATPGVAAEAVGASAPGGVGGI